MFKKSEELSYDDNIIKMYEEYLVDAKGYLSEGQMIVQELKEWELKELIATECGGFPDEYQIE